MRVAILALSILICADSISEHCRPEIVLPKSAFSFSNLGDLIRKKRRLFPAEFNVSINDPYLRQAMIDVFDQMDFYTRLRVRRADIQIDHIWAKAKGGPDNIFNYVLTARKANRDKSDHFDLDSVALWLSINRNNYARRVFERYQQLKQGGQPQRATSDELKKIDLALENSRLSRQSRALLKQALLDRYSKLETDFVRFAKLNISLFERLAEKAILKSELSFYRGAIDSYFVYMQWELGYNARINEARAIETLTLLLRFDESPLGLFRVLRDLSSESFSSFRTAHGFLVKLTEILSSARHHHSGAPQRLLRWLRSTAQTPLREVRSIANLYLRENALRHGEKISSDQFFEGLEVLLFHHLPISDLKEVVKFLLKEEFETRFSFHQLCRNTGASIQRCQQQGTNVVDCLKRDIRRGLRAVSAD